MLYCFVERTKRISGTWCFGHPQSTDRPKSHPTVCIFVSAAFFSFFQSLPPVSSVGGIVWHDANDNGFREANEPGIDGVPVILIGERLYSVSTTTRRGGFYNFPRVRPGNRLLFIESPIFFSTVTFGIRFMAEDLGQTPPFFSIKRDASHLVGEEIEYNNKIFGYLLVLI